jgi:hypothetical protein
MGERTADATQCYAKLQSAGLTVAQENAVDALAAGKKDTEVAALVGVNRVTVTRWRLYNPHFIAALNERRQAIWAGSLDRLRSLIPMALDAVADTLTNASHPDRLQAALGVLKLVPMSAMPDLAAPTEADQLVRGIVEQRRLTPPRKSVEDIFDERKGLPPFEQHVRQTWDELAAKLEPGDPDASA